MGAAVTIELNKPVDASDIRASNNLLVAKNEVIRLRKELGHLASFGNYNAAAKGEINFYYFITCTHLNRQLYCLSVVYDASDIVLGDDEQSDFDRCVDEVAHIRRCLQLSTQSSKRRNRYQPSGEGSESKTPTSSDDHSKLTSTDFDSTVSDDDHDSDSDS